MAPRTSATRPGSSAPRYGKFRLRADWASTPFSGDSLKGPWREIPTLPDHWPVNEAADEAHPFKLATSPARNFLNTSFTETPTSQARERRPTAPINPDDLAALGLGDDDIVRLGNARGQTRLHVKSFAGLSRGVIVCEGVWPPSAFLDGRGVNVLTGDDSVAPYGGAAFHDAHVWARKG
ncbi:MAG: molybdopterin dinucleotide binding domain-containing protein [Roseiarcus sp.]|jgi:anaerobic selenocysteine-containing dehydrogenase